MAEASNTISNEKQKVPEENLVNQTLNINVLSDEALANQQNTDKNS